MKNSNAMTIAWLSGPLAVLVALVSICGLVNPVIYAKETPNWVIQATTQDVVDLFLVVPFLVVSTLYAFRRYAIAVLLWAGIISYLIYTFLIYCFAVHFNMLFIPYCLILGLSGFSFLYFLYIQIKAPSITGMTHQFPVKVISTYFFIISIAFYALWLSEILPSSLKGSVPESILVAGLFTNPVHVIDLSVALPGIFLIAILLRQHKKIAYQVTPVLLTFFVFMDLTIASLAAVFYSHDHQQGFFLILVMSMLALISSILLSWYFRNARGE